MKNVILAGLLGAVILFIWGAVSWMVLPWHQPTFHQFNDEVTVSETIKTNAQQSGIYLMPAFHSGETSGPMVFAAVSLRGMPPMGSAMLMFFLIELVAAILVAYMVAKANLLSYFTRVEFVVIFALAASITCHLPYWAWWHFSVDYILITIADTLIGWFLAGLLIAGLVRPKKSAS